MVKLKGSIVTMVFVSLIGAFLFAGIGTVEAVEISATLKAISDSYYGTCPVKIMFEGAITVKKITKPIQVQYRFNRSDGGTSPIQTLTFDKDGSKMVTTTWTLGDLKKLPTYKGWVEIEVISPVNIKSNKANFAIQCEKPKTKEPPVKPMPQQR